MNLNNIPNRSSQFNKASKRFYILSIIIGLATVILIENKFWIGFGLAVLMISIFSYLHFFYLKEEINEAHTQRFSFLLIVMCLIGVFLIITNHLWIKSGLIEGMGAGLSLYGGIMYVIYLFRNYMNTIR